MWYEIRTGSMECIDEVGPRPSGSKKDEPNGGNDQDMPGAEEPELDLDGIGEIEAAAPEHQARLKVGPSIMGLSYSGRRGWC